MSGAQNSSVSEFIAKNEQILNDFEKGIGLPENQIEDENEYKQYLQMNVSQLERLTPVDCANIAFRLSQFALFLQRSINKEKAKSRLLQNKVLAIISPSISSYSGAWDIQKAAAIRDNDAATALNNELITCQQKEDRLEFVATGVKNLSENLKSIQYAKTRDEK